MVGKILEGEILIRTQTARAIQYIPTWQGLNGSQKVFVLVYLGGGNLSTGRVNSKIVKMFQIQTPFSRGTFKQYGFCDILRSCIH